MGISRWMFSLVAIGLLLGLGSMGLFIQKQRWPLLLEESSLIASTSTNYLGPDKPVTGNPKLVRVEILIRDATEPGGVQIESAEFNGTSIPLQPRDIYGNRGSASFQLRPGKYKLRWKVNRDKFVWPRSERHEEIVEISPRDLWIQIQIEGNDASIR